MFNKNNDKLSSWTSSMFCFGRVLVDVPPNSRLGGGNYKYNFIQLEPVEDMSLTEFQKPIDEREQSLRQQDKTTKQACAGRDRGARAAPDRPAAGSFPQYRRLKPAAPARTPCAMLG
jgi:hypothetical protein